MKREKSLKSRALSILARREISLMELRNKLMPYAQNTDELDELLQELTQRNWQSDERYTEAYINSKTHKHGTFRLKQALNAKGITDKLIQEYLPNAQIELAHAKQIIRKKFKAPAQNFNEQQKQARFLLYRGFSNDIIQQALKQAWLDEN